MQPVWAPRRRRARSDGPRRRLTSPANKTERERSTRNRRSLCASHAREASMDQQTADMPPTSTAATRETEPEVVAGISSAEGNPSLPLSFRIGGLNMPYVPLAMLLGGGLALGYGLSRWFVRQSR